jgi:crossover junction endodeoxyribonuclease RuvC
LIAASSHRATYATGKGSAKKSEIVDVVARRYPSFETHGNDNLADAVIFMAIGRDHMGFPLTDVPAANRKALERVRYSTETPPAKKVKTVRQKTPLSAQ